METSEVTINDFFEILKRRKWSLILPSFIVFLVVALTALALPPIYKSTATILIEEQEIPDDFVKATVTSYAEQRLQTINQRLMTSSRLLEIINRFGLYQDLREKRTNEEIVEKMREDAKLEPISAEVTDRRTGRPTSATIAFTLSYEGKDAPETVQQVAGVLTSLFLEENLRVRKRQARETSRFLEDEMKKVKADLAEIEAKIAAFKEAHINELPELLQVNLQSLNTVERNTERLDEQLRSLKEREGYLQTQLAGIPSESENQDKKRLEELRTQLVFLKTRFSDEYPDVIKTRFEISEIERQLNESSPQSNNSRTDNPAYITLASQLASTQADIDSVKRQIKNLEKKAVEYRRRFEASPKVEQGYKALIVNRNNTQAKFDDLMQKVMEARVAQGLEKEQKGERFTLIDPAGLPEKPYKPNRLAILLIGFVLSIGAGVGSASFTEYNDRSVRNAEALALGTSFPVLGSIPEIVTEKDMIRRKTKRYIRIILMLVVIVGALAAFHYLVMDLNVFWAKLIRRLTP